MSYYEDRIKALEAKVEEMAFRERMKAIPVEAKLINRIAELNAEVERLTKAGDAMADRLMYQGYPATVPAWLAAKEGKGQP